MHFAPRGVFGGSDSFKVTWHQCLERSYLCLLTTKTDLLHHYTQPGSERLVTIPTHEPVIVAQRRAGKETRDINAAGISQREQIASAEASAAEPLESQLGTSLAQPVKPKALTLAPPASARVPYMSLCLVSCFIFARLVRQESWRKVDANWATQSPEC